MSPDPHECYDTGYRRAATRDDATRWLSNTALLQHDHPRIRLLAMRLTQLRSGPREKALACYQFVRKLPFACAADPSNTPAVDVLAAKTGDCCTKGTLFIALLRSIEIPARTRVVSLRPAYLRGIVDTGGELVEHAFTEVLIDQAWQGVDSYAVDLRLGLMARTRLLGEQGQCGYGVHVGGQVAWNARDSSFGHFSSADTESLPLCDFGAFDDVQHFFQATGTHPRPGWVRKQQWVIQAALANWRIRKLREDAPTARDAARVNTVH